jgi:hypothetical protein
MPVDIYFAPKEDAAPVTFSEAERRFSDAGIPFIVEPDADRPEMPWLVFENRSSTVMATVEDEHLVFATVQASFDDDPEFIEQVGRVLESMGFDAGDPDLDKA